jgi:hypothetical protein
MTDLKNTMKMKKTTTKIIAINTLSRNGAETSFFLARKKIKSLKKL